MIRDAFVVAFALICACVCVCVFFFVPGCFVFVGLFCLCVFFFVLPGCFCTFVLLFSVLKRRLEVGGGVMILLVSWLLACLLGCSAGSFVLCVL